MLKLINEGYVLGTLERFCHSNGTWAPSLSRDIQCKLCVGDGRPVTVNFQLKKNIFIIEFFSSSLISLVF
jgi:hypothetical protein